MIFWDMGVDDFHSIILDSVPDNRGWSWEGIV